MAEDAKITDKVEKDLAELGAMIAASPDLQSLISNPLMNRDQQKDGILTVAEKAKFQQLTGNFLGVVADNRRLPILPQIIGAFEAELRKRRGEVEARVETAYALTKAQTEALQKELSKAMGTNVALTVDVNQDLLGGMVVTVGSQMIDDSVRNKLEKLRRTMSSGSNENQATLKEVG
ncbi:MAG: F0F1 ATP synthase subunit delta [Rhodospirillales bacterium]|nr:F0F1 ATP synthase subunit delta [Rhodospirillales bacterium]MCB9995082.1 F0F1 ATP synthase subunit delta [Rhodospirillales bacterium]